MAEHPAKWIYTILLFLYIILILITNFVPIPQIGLMPKGLAKIGTVVEFFLFFLLLLRTLDFYDLERQTFPMVSLFIFVIVVLAIPLIMPNRAYDWYDFLLNAIGLISGMIAHLMLHWRQ